MSDITPAQIIDALQWRYATKVFDASKKIPAETWQALEQTLILTPSSFGLEPWKFVVVEDPAIRETLVGHSWKQRQVADASHLLVLAVKNEIPVSEIDALLQRIVDVRGGTADALAGYRKMLVSTHEQGYMTTQWAKLQAYIALGQFMTAAALLGIDTCPMEGFDAGKYDEVLGLKEQGLTAAVLCPAGYRSEDDRYASLPKVRHKAADVVVHR